MEIIKLRNGAYLLDDSYNANPASVREALMTLKDLKGNHHAYVFLGDMLELGAQADEMHRKIGMLIATIGVKTLFLRGDLPERPLPARRKEAWHPTVSSFCPIRKTVLIF